MGPHSGRLPYDLKISLQICAGYLRRRREQILAPRGVGVALPQGIMQLAARTFIAYQIGV